VNSIVPEREWIDNKWATVERTQSLTPRELEILPLIAQGKSNKEIAQTIGNTAETVRNQIYIMVHKMDSANRTHMVVKAIKEGIITI
jgi:two-component system nitrate/nitrite response regulator NarL